MPLIKSGTRRAISTNIREMMAAGHPQKQAVAAALSTARRYRADGGGIPGMTYKDPEPIKDEKILSPEQWTQARGMPIAARGGRMYAGGGYAQRASDEPELHTPQYLESDRIPWPPQAGAKYDAIPLGFLNRVGQTGTRERANRQMDINQRAIEYPKAFERLSPPTFEERWRGAPQQPRFIEDEFGRMQNVYAEGGEVEPPVQYRPATQALGPFGNVLTAAHYLKKLKSGVRSGLQNLVDQQPMSRARDGYAAGGGSAKPWFRASMQPPTKPETHSGLIKSPVPGRTDKLPIKVGGGSYVLPADHVAAMGQNNSEAGGTKLDQMFKMGHYGAPRSTMPHMPRFGLRRRQFADGGEAPQDPPVDIVAAGGEYVVPPEVVRKIGGGDLDRGHKLLDQWVMDTRRAHIKTLRKLKPPKKS